MTNEEATKTLKENCCSMCAYGGYDMDSCDVSYCDNREAIEVLNAVPEIETLEKMRAEIGDLRFCIEIAGGMTNGEVIQTVFPNCKVKIGNDYVDTDIDTITAFTHEWWNASYQKGGEE